MHYLKFNFTTFPSHQMHSFMFTGQGIRLNPHVPETLTQQFRFTAMISLRSPSLFLFLFHRSTKPTTQTMAEIDRFGWTTGGSKHLSHVRRIDAGSSGSVHEVPYPSFPSSLANTAALR